MDFGIGFHIDAHDGDQVLVEVGPALGLDVAEHDDDGVPHLSVHLEESAANDHDRISYFAVDLGRAADDNDQVRRFVRFQFGIAVNHNQRPALQARGAFRLKVLIRAAGLKGVESRFPAFRLEGRWGPPRRARPRSKAPG